MSLKYIYIHISMKLVASYIKIKNILEILIEYLIDYFFVESLNHK